MNKHRMTIEHETTKERRSVLQPVLIGKRWHVVAHETIPVHRDRGNAPPLAEDPELHALALARGLSVPDMLDKARAKFGANISVAGLILQIKVRGL